MVSLTKLKFSGQAKNVGEIISNRLKFFNLLNHKPKQNSLHSIAIKEVNKDLIDNPELIPPLYNLGEKAGKIVGNLGLIAAPILSAINGINPQIYYNNDLPITQIVLDNVINDIVVPLTLYTDVQICALIACAGGIVSCKCKKMYNKKMNKLVLEKEDEILKEENMNF